MKFTISGEHLKIFQRSHAIEFEEILREEEMKLLRDAYEVSEEKRKGRDYWRESEPVAKVVCHRKIGEIVHQLTETRPVRMGFDLFVPDGLPAGADPISLKDFSSIQGILCGVLFPLEDAPTETVIEEMPPLSLKAGNALFIDPEWPIQWDLFTLGGKIPFYLAVYTNRKAVYVHNRKDPQSRFLFDLGYGFGDRLKEETHPLIFR